jgi:capsular exopolysaccharide synthesis family protein
LEIPNEQQELHLRDYLNTLGRRRWIAIFFFSVVFISVTLVTFLSTPVYKSTVTLLIDMESPNVLTTSDMVSLESRDYFTYKEYFQTQKEIIASRNIINRVFEEFNLMKVQNFAEEKEPLNKFAKTISVEPVRDTRLLKLNVMNENPVLATKIAERIAEIYVKQNLYFITKDELTNLLKNEYLKLGTKRSELAKTYKDKHPKMISISQEMTEMRSRIENIKNSTVNYDKNVEELQDKYGQALSGFKANNVRIIDHAEVPVKPEKPKKRINILLAFIVGILGGIGIAFFLEYFDDTLQGVIDLKKMVDWPILGSIPAINSMGMRRKCMVCTLKPNDPVVEAFRSLRTRILYSSPKESPVRTVVFLSAGPNEGKTTTVSNLAIVLSQINKKVLLVEADMRKPKVTECFKKDNKIGLSDFLKGDTDFDSIVQKTDIDNLFLVTSGPLPFDPSDLLSGDKMKEFLNTAKGKFDYVLFDSPPVPIVSDGLILAKFVDGAVVVVQKDLTSRRVLKQFAQILKDSQIKVIGTLLNKSPISAGSSKYYHYYKK